MAVHYGRYAYLLCDGPGENGRCRASYVREVISRPFAAGAVLSHAVDTRADAIAAGWDAPSINKPCYCPDHKAPAVPEKEPTP